MPTYVYRMVNPDGSDGDLFEVDQPAGAAALLVHPQTGAPVRRVFCVPNLGLKYPAGDIRRKTRDKAFLESKGFARYERDKATGKYHRTAGTDPHAPEVITPE